MNNDLISRSALIKKIESTGWYHISERGNLATGANSELHTPLFKADDIFTALENAPAVDVGPKWISVEDRLPENGQVVLCWYEYFRFGNYNQMYRTYGIGYYFHGNWGGEVAQGQHSKVLAWMSLPEPPKES